jgi:hypothetical protein
MKPRFVGEYTSYDRPALTTAAHSLSARSTVSSKLDA